MRAAIYTRLSYDRHGDELGVTRQEQDCRAIIERRGWELTEVYTDNSASAYKERVTRPEYERLRKDFAANKFEALVCWDLDRLTRQPRQLEDWIEAAEKQGLALVTATGEADLTTPNGRTFARTKAAFSRGEMEMKSFRQKRAARQRAERGEPWGQERPFGFSSDKIAHDPAEAEAVRSIYADFLAGVPQRTLARWLNDNGFTTSRGGEWTQSGVRRLLRNPRYAGLATYRGELTGTEARWMPIVTRETWEAAVGKMDRSRGYVAPGHNSVKHLLTGIAACGVCGRAVRSKNRNDKVRFYTCPGGHVSRDAEKLDTLVTDLLFDVIERQGFNVVPEVDRVDRGELLTEASVLRERKVQLGEEFADGDLDPSTLRAAHSRLDEKLESINQELIASAESPGVSALVTADDMGHVWESMDIHRRRGVIKAVLDVAINPSSVPGSKIFRPEDVEIGPRR